ncbi:MAG TPA: DUF427 domain-containing protein [Pseudonocardiaceae bacterium]|jgi:uncharacterized protein (DUF427 family)
MAREQKIPGPDHPITIEPSTDHVVVRAGDAVIADSGAALVLRESTYPPVYYVPLSDVDPEVLVDSKTQTYCPYKGDASYYSVTGPDGEIVDAIWTYREPYPAVAEILGHVAFYPDRVSITATSA